MNYRKSFINSAIYCEAWARRIFTRNGDCAAVWMYLFYAEELRDLARREL